MNKIEFTRSKKKIYIWCGLISSLFLLGLPVIFFVFKGILTLSNWFFVGYTVTLGYLLLLAIKKTKNAICPNCKTDIYDVIDLAQTKKIEVKYCIHCGAKIEL